MSLCEIGKIEPEGGYEWPRGCSEIEYCSVISRVVGTGQCRGRKDRLWDIGWNIYRGCSQVPDRKRSKGQGLRTGAHMGCNLKAMHTQGYHDGKLLLV